MGSFTSEVFVDPSRAASPQVGDGSIGDPYSSLRHAFEAETPSTTHRFNLKAGSADLLEEDLYTSWNNASWTGPMWVVGYTAVADDGGIGEIDAQANSSIWFSTSYDSARFVNIKLGNCGSNQIFRVDDNSALVNCEVYGTTDWAFSCDQNGYVFNTWFHDVAKAAQFDEGVFQQNRVDFTGDYGMEVSGGNATLLRHNVFIARAINGSCVRVRGSRPVIIDSNSMYAVLASTGAGILEYSSSDFIGYQITNNLIQGFSGVGGHGIAMLQGSRPIRIAGGNSVFDCETGIDYGSHTILRSVGADEILTESPFVDPANGDFTPKNVGAVYEGHLPTKIAGDFF